MYIFGWFNPAFSLRPLTGFQGNTSATARCENLTNWNSRPGTRTCHRHCGTRLFLFVIPALSKSSKVE